MNRVERHIFTKATEYNALAHKAKNLYNRANYLIRQRFFYTSKKKEQGKRKHARYLNYFDIIDLVNRGYIPEYYHLPAQTAQQILRILDKNWKSFFKAIKRYNTNKELFTGRPKLPGYVRSEYSAFYFTNQQIKIKDGYIIFPLNLNLNNIKTKITGGLRLVRIIPKYTCYIVEIVYKVTKTINTHLDNNLYLGIDLGVNNLVATANNASLPPVLINGRPLKSINQYFNNKKSKLMSYIGNVGTSNRIQKLTHDRNCKIDDYMHKTSRFIVDYAQSHNIGNIVIGNNSDWKREINIGKKNNQNFVSIPFGKLIEQIEYKAAEKDISVIRQEESYTSKCSLLDNEAVAKQSTYQGKRIKRGLFKSALGKLINADVNGAGNIIRKVAPDAFANGVEAVGLQPIKVCFT